MPSTGAAPSPGGAARREDIRGRDSALDGSSKMMLSISDEWTEINVLKNADSITHVKLTESGGKTLYIIAKKEKKLSLPAKGTVVYLTSYSQHR